ncbi:MAG TPA: hypothetical protein VD903_18855 [Pseudonocardia sp.]|nr:hypothetical protein [Pseudonocardia sp.]
MTPALGVDDLAEAAAHPRGRALTPTAQDPARPPDRAADQAADPRRGVTRSRSLRHAVLLLACVAALLGAVELAVVTAGAVPTWLDVLFVVTAGAFVAAGVLAWLRRPSSDIGAVLTAGGSVWLAKGCRSRPRSARTTWSRRR